jgi:hypothetical protein
MSDPLTSTELALLHNLQAAAADAGQLPKHVAHELQEQGLVRSDGPSPGAVSLTADGRARLQALQAAAGDVMP